jgi:hypothetical protein
MQANARRGTTGHQQLQPHWLAGRVAQCRLDVATVLGVNPVALEAVAHAQRSHQTVLPCFGNVGRGQGNNPSLELLFGQIVGKAGTAALPEV